MTSISSLAQFFTLPSSTDTASDASTSDATAMPSLAEALAQAASSDSSNSDSGSDSPFLLDLSPDAQNYLSQLSSGSQGSATPGTGFVLSHDQQNKLNGIIAKYKDAPFDQDTYDKIQQDMEAAGLSPQQLGLMDQMRQFSPVSELVDAMSGKSSGLNPSDFGNTTDESANASSYMQQVYNQWQTISTTAVAAEAADDGTSAES